MQELAVFLARFLIYVPLFAAFLLALKKKSFRLFFQIASSALIVEIMSEVTKFIIPIKRPFEELGLPNPGVWIPLSENSFFSSHTGVAFAIGAVLWPRNKVLSLLCFGFGGVAGVLRVIIKVHYPLDIAGGAVIGTLIGFMMTKVVTIKD